MECQNACRNRAFPDLMNMVLLYVCGWSSQMVCPFHCAPIAVHIFGSDDNHNGIERVGKGHMVSFGPETKPHIPYAEYTPFW